jgi:transcriptional regulator
MRSNPDYSLTDVSEVKALIRDNPWATLISHSAQGLVVSHYPFLLEENEEGIALVSHVGRPDERLHELGDHDVVVVFHGPSGYISPGWYDLPTGVPTWNFATVHAHGRPQLLSDSENLDVLERLVDWFEDPLPEPFRMRATLENEDYAERIVHGTVGFRLSVERFEAKNKMSQDKAPAVVDRIVDSLRQPGPYFNPLLADRIDQSRI